jgi:Na+-transporting NADH:ubiquinone oxidoreductase subunit C
VQQYSNTYIFLFTAAICICCSLVISISAVGLRERQEQNKVLKKQRNVLLASGLMAPKERLSTEEIQGRFQDVEIKYFDLASGDAITEADFKAEVMVDAPEGNAASILEVPEHIQAYYVMKDGKVDSIVLPIYGKGLWSTLYGYLALDDDANTVVGLTYYQHGETPGLGGEVDNPRWKALWPGRIAYDADGKVALSLSKGPAGSVEDDPHHVDGLSGATLTSRGVSGMVQFWLGEEGYKPFLNQFSAAL